MILYYVHDPMCSWCWGFETCKNILFSKIPSEITVKYLLGGLAIDTDQIMPDSTIMMLQQTWKEIEQRIPGKQFNFDFWAKNIPRRSTYPACRSVIAAGKQNKEQEMIHAIQQAYYQHAKNPSDKDVLLELANELDLNMGIFRKDLGSNETNSQLEAEISQVRDMNVEGFPALVLKSGHSQWKIPIDYTDPEPMFKLITNISE